MNRRLSPLAVAKILDALTLRRQAALLSLPYEATETDAEPDKGKRARSSDKHHALYERQLRAPLSAELACNELVESAITDAIELRSLKQAVPLDTSAGPLVVANEGGGASSSGETNEKASSGAPEPCAEIGSTLEGRRLQGLSFDGLRFTAVFNRSDLSGASLRQCYVAHSTFNLARLNNADLSGGQVHSCTFVGTEAGNVKAVNCRFSHCQFKQCDLKNWDVRGATFFHCSFTLSDLCGWTYDGQTTLIEPVGWSRCRRLAWHVRSNVSVGDCRVVGKGMERALSLPPAALPFQRNRHQRRKKQ